MFTSLSTSTKTSMTISQKTSSARSCKEWVYLADHSTSMSPRAASWSQYIRFKVDVAPDSRTSSVLGFLLDLAEAQHTRSWTSEVLDKKMTLCSQEQPSSTTSTLASSAPSGPTARRSSAVEEPTTASDSPGAPPSTKRSFWFQLWWCSTCPSTRAAASFVDP